MAQSPTLSHVCHTFQLGSEKADSAADTRQAASLQSIYWPPGEDAMWTWRLNTHSSPTTIDSVEMSTQQSNTASQSPDADKVSTEGSLTRNNATQDLYKRNTNEENDADSSTADRDKASRRGGNGDNKRPDSDSSDDGLTFTYRPETRQR